MTELIGPKWREANRDRSNGYSEKYKRENRELVLKRQLEYNQKIKSNRAIYARKWRKQNSESVRKTNEKRKDQLREWRSKNKNLIRQWKQDFLNRNPGIQAAYVAKRRTALLNATPSWTDANHIAQIFELYETANRLTKYYGIKFHVDHIEPLQCKNSSGIHTWWNLRVIPATQNLSKGNKLIVA